MNIRSWLLPLIVFIGCHSILGQELIAPSNRTPYNTILTHLQYLQVESYNPEITKICFDSTLYKNKSLTKWSRQLKMIFDAKGLFVYPSRLPNKPDYIDSSTRQSVFILFPKELPQIYVEKHGTSWWYSNESVQAIPALIKQIYPYGTHHLISWLPASSQKLFAGLSGWQFLGLLVVLIFCGLIYFLMYYLLHAIFGRILKSKLKNWHVDDKRVWQIARLFSLIIIFKIAKTLFGILQFSALTNKYLHIGFNIAISILVMVLAFKIVDLISNQLSRVVEGTKSKMDDQLLPIVNSMGKIIIGLLGFIYILNQLDVNVTAILAGVSIGGLALALAAQDTVKNLIGSLMIFIDKPFQIGDYIEIDGQNGTVEEVGFRTTRLRTVDTSIVAIPNGNVANIAVNNKGVRPKRMINLSVGVTYNTPPHYLKAFKKGLEQLVIVHTKLVDEPRFIFINALEASSINIVFRTYVETLEYQEELAVREEVILSILSLAETLGINLAFPSSTIYIDQMPGQDTLNNSFKDNEERLNEKIDQFFAD